MPRPPKQRHTFSFSPGVLELARTRADEGAYESLSVYVEALIRYDFEYGGAHTVLRDEGGIHYRIEPRDAPRDKPDD